MKALSLTFSSISANLDDEISAAFKMFDIDENGYISTDELQSVLMRIDKNITMAEINAMIRETDTDGDGFINFEEFAKMMKA